MDVEEAYQNALNYLYTFVDYSRTHSFDYSPQLFDLTRMHNLLSRIGDPHRDYPVLHVAGTKGKGSVSALCAGALKASGYSTGLFTSPHLSDYAERIQVQGKNISHRDLADLIEELKPHIQAVPKLTTFEITTALAFLYFARKNVNAAVIEVGLGGRLDATNVVDPVVSVITSLSMEHTRVLGDTLEKIATEKAGIIKPGRPVVSSPQQPEALRVIETTCDLNDSNFTLVGRDYFFAPQSHSLEGQSLLVWPSAEQKLVNEYIESGGRTGWEPVRLNIPLLGIHQAQNAATAYTTMKIANQAGLSLATQDIQRGFEEVVWPGRFELLRRHPPVVIDSAHNPDSALKLRLALDDYFPGLPVILVFGALEDKDVAGIFSVLLPRIQRVIATQSTHPRALAADLIVDHAHRFGRPAKVAVPIEDALIEALSIASNEAVVLATGSLSIAGAVREMWLATQGVNKLKDRV